MPRPRAGEEIDATKQVGIRMPIELYEDLVKLAARKGKSYPVSRVIRDAAEAYVNEQKVRGA